MTLGPCRFGEGMSSQDLGPVSASMCFSGKTQATVWPYGSDQQARSKGSGLNVNELCDALQARAARPSSPGTWRADRNVKRFEQVAGAVPSEGLLRKKLLLQ